MKNRNRALQGDVVAVELLPPSEWKGRSTALTGERGEEKGEDPQSQPMPTGSNGNLHIYTLLHCYHIYCYQRLTWLPWK